VWYDLDKPMWKEQVVVPDPTTNDPTVMSAVTLDFPMESIEFHPWPMPPFLGRIYPLRVFLACMPVSAIRRGYR